MKKGILSITALAVVLLISFTSLTVNPAANATEKKPAVTVSEAKDLSASSLNMLNHNFVYNDAFESVYEMTACSEVALLDKAEDGYIKQSLIAGYLYNMYGVENADFATVTKDFPVNAKLEIAKPVYITLPGWKTDIRGIKNFDDLPENCKNYVETIEKEIGVHIGIVTNGPKREEFILR